jgi:HlyD family secretion protein
MIKNSSAALAFAALAACSTSGAESAEAHQGILEHEERALGFEIAGRLVAVEVDEGASTTSGTALARVDERLAEIERLARLADLEAARARLALLEAGSRNEDIRATRADLDAARESVRVAELELGRQRNLAESGAAAPMLTDRRAAELAEAQGRVKQLTERLRVQRAGARSEEIDAAEAGVAAAEQAVRAAERRVEQHTLLAPIAGTILDVLREPGEVLVPGAPVVTMADLDRPYVDVFVPQDEIDTVRRGARAAVRIDAYARTFDGVVEHIGSRTEFTPRFLFSERERPSLVIRVRIAVDDPEHLLRAGVPTFVTLEER